MIYGFTKQSEGHAKIYSEVGVGTTIKLFLPRCTDDLVADEVAASSPDMPRAETGETVLVVEDESVVRDLVVEVLATLATTRWKRGMARRGSKSCGPKSASTCW